MRIVHLATTLAGGAGIGMWRYHQALRSQGVDSRVLVMDPPPGTGADVGQVHWRKRPLPFRVLRRLGLVRTTQERLRAEIAARDRGAGAANYELFTLPCSDYRPEEHAWVQEADIVNLQWVAGLLDWRRFLRRIRQPLVITLHDQQPYLGGFHYAADAENNPHLAALESRFRETKRRALQGHRMGVIANSRWNEEQARRSGFFAAETPFETIYYPLDPSRYRSAPPAAAKSGFGLDPERKVVGFACENLNNRRKGFMDLLAALALLPGTLRDRITLLSFGRDPSAELRSQAGLPWRHLGYLESDPAKAAAYAAMDVFVAPSRAEAFGLTALEAQAVGIPVVANPVGGLREAVVDAGRDCAPDGPRPEAIRDGIVALLADESRRTERIAAGRQLVASRHDPARIGAALAAFHRRILG